LSAGEQAALDGLENRGSNGRPLGAPDFIAAVKRTLGQRVRLGERGRKPQSDRAG
jgi:hypothetical protein